MFHLKIQTTIENFFAYEREAAISKQSKRMINAINSFKNQIENPSNKKQNTNIDANLSDEDNEENVMLVQYKEKSSTNRVKTRAQNKKHALKPCTSQYSDNDVVLVEDSANKIQNNKQDQKVKSTSIKSIF